MTNETDSNHTPECSIIGVGASAGGLNALRAFFEAVPVPFAHAFVVVQHLSPDFKSMMGELLEKVTRLKIKDVIDQEVVQPGVVYMTPPGKTITLSDGRLTLTDKGPRGLLVLPINIFFESLASELKERAIGVVLSGSGSDGTLGVKAIKEAGGLAVVQDPETAGFDGMPNSAIKTGLIDFILPPEAIPGALTRYLLSDRSSEALLEEVDSAVLTQILDLLELRTSIDFTQYKPTTIIRRINRRVLLNQCDGLEGYFNFLQEHRSEAKILSRDILIGVTRFFRDPAAWDALETDILPKIIERKQPDETLKCWVIGCSTGEEAYSLSIALQEGLKAANRTLDIKIFATDLEQSHIDQASLGMYDQTIISQIPAERLELYFSSVANQFKANPIIRKNIIFSTHNVLSDPPFGKMDLIICRNLLIYLLPETQSKVIKILHYGLNENGYLFLGPSETLAESQDAFKEINRRWRLFESLQKRHARLTPENFPSTPYVTQIRRKLPVAQQLKEHLNKVLLQVTRGAAIYVDEQLIVRHATGAYHHYLALPEEGLSLSILKMTSGSLLAALNTSLRKANRLGTDIVTTTWLEHEGGREKVEVLVSPIQLDHADGNYYLILIQPWRPELASLPESAEASESLKEPTDADYLQEILDETREHLTAALEEVHTTNEEFQVTNEELVVSNEELQSTNEELQSVNEELHTVNSEYQHKIEELQALNDDIENLLQSSRIGTIFLDSDLRIRWFSPGIEHQFNMLDIDIGRPLDHLSGNFSPEDMTQLKTAIEDVFNTGKPQEREVQVLDGTHYLERINPFIVQSGEIEGVVLNFIDIESQVQTQEALARLSEKLSLALAAGDIGVWDLDVAHDRLTWSDLMYSLYGVDRQTFKGNYASWRSFIHPDDIEETERLWQIAIDEKQSFLTNFRILTSTGEIKWLHTSAKIVYGEDDQPIRAVGINFDLTPIIINNQRKLEADLMLEGALVDDRLGRWEWDPDRNETEWSTTIHDILGLPASEIAPSKNGLFERFHPDDYQLAQGALLDAVERDVPYTLKLRILRPSGEQRWVISKGYFLDDRFAGRKKLMGTLLDITDLQLAEREREYWFDESPDFQAILNFDGQILRQNRAWTDLLGWKQNQIHQKSLLDFVALEDREEIAEALDRLRRGESVNALHIRFLDTYREPRWLSWSAKPWLDTGIIISTARDITEELDAAETLKRVMDDLASTNAALEHFAYAASHDLREPLNTISSFVDLIRLRYNNALDEDGEQMLQYLSEASNRMQALVKALLDYSRVSRKKLRLEKLSLIGIINEIRQDFAILLDETGTVIRVEQDVQFFADQVLIRQIFSNLIMNSIKYRHPERSPQISISAQLQEQEWLFEFCDNGIGIDEKYWDKIFEIFRQLAPRQTAEGIGLGLTLCRRIVQLHGGEIWVDRSDAEGTRFRFTIWK